MNQIDFRSICFKEKDTGGRKSLVHLHNVGVKYVVGSKGEDVQSRAFNLLLGKRKRKAFWALNDVSIDANAGDIIGIIGLNGAGKTTLCRVISGILGPDTGQIEIDGDVSALLALGTGFNNNLSGRENIFLNGMMLGFRKEDIQEIFDEIVDFSGLSEFIDQPIKYYSTGMISRLGFSIAAIVEPDILLIDEVLRTGDLEFSEKAGKKIQEIIGKSKLVFIVTHNLGFVEKYCTKGLWIHRGKVAASGESVAAVSLYKEFVENNKNNLNAANLQKTKSIVKVAEVVKVKNLGLNYPIKLNKVTETVAGQSMGKYFSSKKTAIWPLQDVNFTVYDGEILGIVGRNGAGKTTLCKVLAGVLKPDKGAVSICGKLSALMSLGTGFNIQLTGTDNIYLNGLMLGISKKKIDSMLLDIINFSELRNFIDQPIKNYSSGMKSRLSFSIAAAIEPEILIIDEVLSAGDTSFYEKASAKIQELIERSKAVIVVTHNMAFVERICTRAIWIENGHVRYDGSPNETIIKYRQFMTK